ncbi:hypothetical protein EVA_19561 [gut metagenome]|uniref:Uncharacterized protein n=1 Tax=gut metagenome TaxID=749906 RepID=J9FRX3_9ZZZZ
MLGCCYACSGPKTEVSSPGGLGFRYEYAAPKVIYADGGQAVSFVPLSSNIAKTK